MKYLISLITIIIGGDFAPIGYILGIGFSAIGSILLVNVVHNSHFIGALTLCLIGLIIMFFRIRKDILEIRDDIN